MIVVQMCDDSFSMWMCLWNGFEVLSLGVRERQLVLNISYVFCSPERT